MWREWRWDLRPREYADISLAFSVALDALDYGPHRSEVEACARRQFWSDVTRHVIGLLLCGARGLWCRSRSFRCIEFARWQITINRSLLIWLLSMHNGGSGEMARC
jgi:hypothetical protein